MTAALLIFGFTYLVLVIGELPGFRVYRTSAATAGAVCMVVFGVLPADRPPARHPHRGRELHARGRAADDRDDRRGHPPASLLTTQSLLQANRPRLLHFPARLSRSFPRQ